MSGSPTFSKLTEQSLEDHGLIRFHLDQLGRGLRGFDTAAATAEAMRELAVRIDSFKDRLEEHFRLEEGGGLLQAVVDALPQAESDVRRIRAEHARMGSALDEVRRLARSGDTAQAGALRAELGRILDAIREHEREEDELVRRAIRHS